MRGMVDDNIIYTPDQLNTFFETPQTVRPSSTDFDSAYNSPTEEFAFINTFEQEVYNAIHQIRSNTIGADGVTIKFLKNHPSSHTTVPSPMSICHPAIQRRGNYQKIMPVVKTNDPGSLSQTIGLLASWQLCPKKWK
jgi:hypothetical protein